MEIKTRKKVLYLITKSNWGGAQRYVYDLATNLDTEKFEPVVAMGGNGILAEMLHNSGIRTVTLYALQNSTSITAATAAGRELYHLLRTEQPDIFHVNSSVAGFIGTAVGRLARIPRIIFTSHGWAFNEDRPATEKFILKFFHWLTVLFSHRTIAVSTGLLNQMRWLGAWRKMKVINPGRTIGVMYEKEEAREKICDFFPRLAPYHNDPWLVCLAELHPIKRHMILFEAIATVIKNHPNVRLLCIGDGTLRADLENKIAALGLNEHIFLVGHLTEAARFLKAFDIALLVSKSESYGYVLHEAGLAGVPIIASDVGGIPDIVTNENTGLLITPDNQEAITAAINRLLDNPQLGTQYAQTLTQALATRTVAAMVKKVETLYVL
jgi:glycosyltransferase involved in cell wall biosynthesis